MVSVHEAVRELNNYENERNKRENGHKYVCLIKFYLHILFCLVALRIFEVLHMVQVHVGKATPQQSKVRAKSSHYGDSESHQSPAVNKKQQNCLIFHSNVRILV